MSGYCPCLVGQHDHLMIEDAEKSCETAGRVYSTEPFYTESGGLLMPGPLTGGPWNPSIQHGGPISGVLAHLVESVPATARMRTVRHTVDMMRGVPITALRPEVEVVRSGRRIQVVRASLYAGTGSATLGEGGIEVARATSLRMRVASDPNPVDLAKTAHEEDRPHPVPEESVLLSAVDVGVPAFFKGVEFRQTGGYRNGAPGLIWLRMHNTMVEGHETTPFVRIATMADMASMAAQYLDPNYWTTINADLTIAVFRDPVGEWIGIRGLHKNDGDGIGLSEAVLYDLDGRVGRATASILIEPR